MRISSVKLAAVLSVSVLAGLPADGGNPPCVAVLAVASRGAEVYESTLRGFERAWTRAGGRLTIVHLEDEAAARAEVERAIGDLDPCGLFTLGSAATQVGSTLASQRDLVATLIVDPSALEGAAHGRAVLLEHSLESQFELVRSVLPRAHRIGVLYSLPENEARVVRARPVAAALGFELVEVPLAAPEELPGALEATLRQVDALWGLPDPIALNRQTAKKVLMSSIQEGVPLIGPSVSWVQAGALCALDWDYEDLGAQCAELLLERRRGDPRVVLPRVTRYAINLRTAAAIRVSVPETVRSGAAQVFE